MSSTTQQTVSLSRWDERPLIFVNGDLPSEARDALDEELSYEVPDAAHTDAWKRGDWDGKEHLFKQSRNGTYYFPAGCLGRVRSVLDGLGVGYEIEGVVRPGRGDLDLPWESDIELRDYQQDAVDTAVRQGSGLITMPTGAGKTITGLKMAQTISRPTIVFCHRQEIADQWVAEMEDIFGVTPARCYGGTRENGDLMVALYQSVYEDGDIRDDVRLDHDVLLADEAHRVGADTFSRVTLAANARYRFGFSATPEREDNATLKVIGGTGEMISDISPESLIEQGYLAEPEWKIIEAPSPGGSYRNWQDEYREGIVENSERNEIIASEVMDFLPKPCYVHVERINHGERLESMIPGARFVHGSSADRDEIIDEFRSGDRDVLISTLLGEGVNVPAMASMVMAGGLKTSVGAIQKVGRALRPETENATIVDFADRGYWIGDHSEERIRTYKRYYGEYGP